MKFNKYAFVMMLILIFVLTCGLSFASEERDTIKFEITITNLTRGQVFSPPIAMGHDRNFSLFRLGAEASEELAALAENGDTGPLVEQIKEKYPYAVAEGPIPPGETRSIKLEIGKSRLLRLISVAGMLVGTNDAFFAARDVWFLGRKNMIVEAPAYDAGSEKNSEKCWFIPGPPCDRSGNLHDPADPEGFVHIHAGIHGIRFILKPADHDWKNPVAKITIRRIYP